MKIICCLSHPFFINSACRKFSRFNFKRKPSRGLVFPTGKTFDDLARASCFHLARATMGYVYFFQVVDQDYYKIGRTSTKVESRFNSISPYCPFKLKIAGLIASDDYAKIEKDLHRRFHSRRQISSSGYYTEWFNLNVDEVRDVLKLYGGNYFEYGRPKSTEIVNGRIVEIHQFKTEKSNKDIDILRNKKAKVGMGLIQKIFWSQVLFLAEMILFNIIFYLITGKSLIF